MKLEQIDEMIDAHCIYETKRLQAYNGDEAKLDHVYQFVTREQLRELERTTGIRAKRIGEGSYSTAQIEYRGCVFQAPSGRAD